MQKKTDLDLTVFHKLSEKGNPYDTIDDEIEEYLINNFNIFVLDMIPYFYVNGYYRMDKNGKLVKAYIKALIVKELRTAPRINRIYQLLLNDYRIEKKQEDINKYQSHWINFKNGMFDVKEWKLIPHDPKYCSINQVPHNYSEFNEYETSTFRKFVESRILNHDERTMLFEFMGYCMTKDIQFQKFMFFYGLGDSGKSTIINYLIKIVGEENVCNIPPQRLNDKFTTASLLHKILNSCGDISSSAIKETDTIKQLTGNDSIKAEYKGGEIFFFKNYAKLLFSANDMPLVLDEKSNGFYRRLLILKFNTKGDYIPELERLIESEIESIIPFFLLNLKNAYGRGKLFESEDSKREVNSLRRDSDTVEAFLYDRTTECQGRIIDRVDLYSYYKEYCENENRVSLANKGFFNSMRVKGYQDRKSNGVWVFDNLEVKFQPVNKATFNKWGY
jgi:P4 family phage/plasmid primase-like protien